MCILTYVYILGKIHLLKPVLIFKIGFFLYCCFENFWFVLDTNPLSDQWLSDFFCSVSELTFVFIMMSSNEWFSVLLKYYFFLISKFYKIFNGWISLLIVELIYLLEYFGFPFLPKNIDLNVICNMLLLRILTTVG